MNIAQVTHNYLPHLGGIEFYTYRLSRDLTKKGENVKILTTDLKTPKENREKGAIYFKAFPTFMRNPFAFGMIKHLLKNSYDILHLHSIWFLPSLEAILLKKRAKIILTLHGVYPEKASLPLKLFLNLFKPFANFILKKSDAIIVLSNSEKEKLLKLFKVDPIKIKVIPNGIDIEKEPSIKEIKLLRNEYNLKDNKVILFTGRIIKDKNPEVLIKAFSTIKKHIKNTKLVFIGPISKNYKKELKELIEKEKIEDFVVFIGPLSIQQRKKLLTFYKLADIFVSLGSWEGLPTRLMEAMQFGVPCITYVAGGSSELIKDGYNGLVIKELNPIKLANNLLFLLKGENSKIKNNAIKTIKKQFDWRNISDKIHSLYLPIK